jgi:antitoxin (DNA-binding transcriptional repressor) of toxin-antitoxin stability system
MSDRAEVFGPVDGGGICTDMATLKEVNITELRQNLRAYLARARRGAHFRVASRGKVVAELSPPAAPKARVAAARARLKGSVRRYEPPLEPVTDPGEWRVNK